MLTQDDIKAIRKVVREEVVSEVKDSTNNIESQIRFSNLHLRDDIKNLDDRMKNVEIRLDNISEDIETKVTKELKPIKKNLEYVKRTVDIIAKNYDEGDVRLEKRIKRIEDHLDLPETN